MVDNGLSSLGFIVSVFQKQSFESAFFFVGNVVGQLVICKNNVDVRKPVAEFCPLGDRSFGYGVNDAMRFFYLNVFIKNVMRYRRQKSHVVGKREPRHLSAGGSDRLAYSAVKRSIQIVVL